MILCSWSFICAIVFSLVAADSDICTSFSSRATETVAKKNNKSREVFLGEFEQKILHSRNIVNEIHNQSIIKTNSATANENDLGTKQSQESLVDRYRNSLAFNRAIEDKQIAAQTQPISDTSFSDAPHIDIARRRASTLIYPEAIEIDDKSRFRAGKYSKPSTTIKFRQIEPFGVSAQNNNSRIDGRREQNKVISLTTEFVHENMYLYDSILYGGVAGFKIRTSTKHPKRLMRPGPSRFQPEDEYDLFQRSIYRSKTATNISSTTKYKNPPKYPGKVKTRGQQEFFKKEQKQTHSERFDDFITADYSISTTKYVEPAMRNGKDKHVTIEEPETKYFKAFTILTSTEKTAHKFKTPTKSAKVPHRTMKRAVVNDITSINTTVKKQENKFSNTTSKVRQRHPTLSSFYLNLKQKVFSDPDLDYPDIFSKPITKAVSTQSADVAKDTKPHTHAHVTTTSTKLLTSTVIPDLEKDYLNIKFRASSLKDTSLRDEVHDSQAEVNEYNDKTEHTPHKRIKNKNLENITDGTSSSLIDEETYFNVNLLDQLYHHNDSLTT